MKIIDRLQKYFKYFLNNNFLVFIFFLVSVFATYHKLFNSYFEADEWFHFTHYFPLTREPSGIFIAIVKSVTDTMPLSAGQHIVPIGEVIFFLNTLFFGLHFIYYAVASLFTHSLNSFLVWLLIKELLKNSKNKKTHLIAILGGIFFALSAIPMHAVTWAAFYGQNVLSVTFFLLSILFLIKAFDTNKKSFLYLSALLFFLDLLTKETAASLFLIIPFLLFANKRDFPLKLVLRIFAIPLVLFIQFRFVLPLIYFWANNYASSSVQSGFLSGVNINLLLFRAATFPFKMISEVFFSYNSIQQFLALIGPIIYPQFGEGGQARYESYMSFIYGAGLNFAVYILSIIFIFILIHLSIQFYRSRKIMEFKAILLGIVIVIASTFPLIFPVLHLEWWGLDFFDSRHFYMPTVGAAILFPFLVFYLSENLSKLFAGFKVYIATSLFVLIIFAIWLINNMYVFNLVLDQSVNKFALDRREVVSQLKNYLPILNKKTVFYIETDGLSPFGPVLPFYTSVPQALTVIYYDKNPLPDKFFNKTLFEGKSQGYSYFEGRGFGYFTSRKDIADALIKRKFKVADIHAFYYKSLKGELLDNTLRFREEMQDYLNQADIFEWKLYEDRLSKIKFLYKPPIKVEEFKSLDANIMKSIMLSDSRFKTEIFVIKVPTTFNINDNIQFLTQVDGRPLSIQNTQEKELFFDRYHSNKALLTNEDQPRYFIRLDDILIYLKVDNASPDIIRQIERILGSMKITDEK